MKTLLLLLSLLAFSSPHSFAQKGVQFLKENLPRSNQQLLDPMRSYALSGTVQDQYGAVVADALVKIADQRNASYRTDENGQFRIPDVRPDDYLTVGKNGYLNNSRLIKDYAYFLDPKGQLLLSITLPVLDIRFEVGPEGGYYNGAIRMQVPPGALNRRMEISACMLPPGFLNQGEKMHASSLGSIHFEPAGLSFQKPIELSMPAMQTLPSGANPAVLHTSTKNGVKLVEEISQPNLQINGINWTFAITHFSNCKLVDKNTMIRKVPSEKPPGDANLDGSEDDQDADRIVHLIGGPQQMVLSTTITSTQSVLKRESSSATDQKADTHAQGGGVKIKGVGASVEEAKTTSLSKTEAEAYGIEMVEEQTFTSRVEVEVAEPNERCKMLFALYELNQWMKYVKVQPSAKELDNLKAQIGNDPPNEEGWHFRKTLNASSVKLGRTLYSGMRLAVKVAPDGSLEVYALAENLMVRRLSGLKSMDCQEVKKTKKRSVRYRYYPPPTGQGAELYSITYLGLKRGAKADKSYQGVECGTSISEEWSESRNNMEFRETDQSSTQENTTTVELKAGLELDYKGIIQVEGHASHQTEKSKQVSEALYHAVQNREQEHTTFALTIFDTHKYHESDHKLFPLYHVYERRDWFYEFPNSAKLPASLQKWMRRAKGQGDGRIQGNTKKDQRILLVQEGDKEYWYVSGPPNIIFRDAGEQLERVDDRSCKEGTPTQEQEEHQTEPKEDRSTRPRPQPKEADQSSDVLPKEEANLIDPSPNHQLLTLGVGGFMAFSRVQSHASGQAEEQLMEALYADQLLFERLFESLGGGFFPGTFDAPPIIEKGTLGLDAGWLISGGYNFSQHWQASILFGQSYNRWSANFPVMVINTEDGDTRIVQGDISTKLQTNRLAVNLIRSFGAGKYRPFAGIGVQRSSYSIGQAQAELAGLVFPLWSERSADGWGGLVQGGLDANFDNNLGLRIVLQGASEVQTDGSGGFSNTFVPAILLYTNWRF